MEEVQENTQPRSGEKNVPQGKLWAALFRSLLGCVTEDNLAARVR
jgi:hypothetical protein